MTRQQKNGLIILLIFLVSMFLYLLFIINLLHYSSIALKVSYYDQIIVVGIASEETRTDDVEGSGTDYSECDD
jgi:hypothetical protein